MASKRTLKYVLELTFIDDDGKPVVSRITSTLPNLVTFADLTLDSNILNLTSNISDDLVRLSDAWGVMGNKKGE